MSFVPLVRLWLWVSAFASAAGWTLSACGQLNRAGYAVAFVVFILFILAGRSVWLPARAEDGRWKLDRPWPSSILHFRFHAVARRFRRPLPLCFVALTALIFLGDLIYPPTNYTALTYHIPRVLHWLAEGQWHWIHTVNTRMNYTGTAFEWLSAPLLLFLGSDRALFLLNFFPFLLLPGLTFSVFSRLGIRPRLAWQWMWLLPTGYNYLLQAGSTGNDSISAIYALAAIDFGCRAWQSRRPRDLWLSLLAAGLLIGTKPTSLPLLLPWLILIFALLPALRQKMLPSVLVSALALLVSFFPMALMNKIHCGDWLGASIESGHVKIQNPLTGILGNGLELALDNFVPPFFPAAGWWSQHYATFLPRSWIEDFQAGFFALGELPTEDWAGIGFGLSVLAVVLALAAIVSKKGWRWEKMPAGLSVPPKLCRWVLWTPWLALMAYCVKAGMSTPARLIAPYYPLLLPLLLAGAGTSQIIRRGWWRLLVAIVMVLSFAVLIVSPDRPLWPAKTILTRLHERHPGQRQIARALKVYAIYAERSDSLAGVRALLPPEIKAVGFIGTEDDMEISLWRPFGHRRVEDFFLTDPPEKIRQRVPYAVFGGFNLERNNMKLADWLARSGAELVGTTNATLKVGEDSQTWYVVRFKP
jgi:hypothetical protein